METKVEFEEEISISKTVKPGGYTGEYMFVETPEGETWKARITHISRGGVQAISITVSQVDESGLALKRGGISMVSEPSTHTFNETEWAKEDFDPEERITRIVEQRIVHARQQFKLADRLKEVTEKLVK